MPTQSMPKDYLLDLNGIEMAVRTWGEQGAIPVLALHGWLDNAASFERLAPLMEDCFIVAPDLIGHGRSDHRREDSGYYLWEHAEDVLALVDRLGLGPFHVVAHGMGSGIASILALLTSTVVSMTFLDGMGVPFTVDEGERLPHLARAYRLKRMVQRSQAGSTEPLSGIRFENLEQAMGQRRDRLGAEVSEEAIRLLAQRDLLQTGDGYRWRHDERLALPESMPLTEKEACKLLQQIHCPLYLILARQGMCAGPMFNRRKSALPAHAQVSWYPGGHHFHLDEPERALAEQIGRILTRHEGAPVLRRVNE